MKQARRIAVALGFLFLGYIHVQGQRTLEQYTCVSNHHVKFSIARTSLQLIGNGQCIPGKFHLRLQDAACVDSVTLADLQFMYDNFANTEYDWGFNWVFYAYYDLDPIPIHDLKPRKWRKYCKADDLARWQQLLAEKAVGGWH